MWSSQTNWQHLGVQTHILSCATHKKIQIDTECFTMFYQYCLAKSCWSRPQTIFKAFAVPVDVGKVRVTVVAVDHLTQLQWPPVSHGWKGHPLMKGWWKNGCFMMFPKYPNMSQPISSNLPTFGNHQFILSAPLRVDCWPHLQVAPLQGCQGLPNWQP